jgi:hypothetical protein
MKDKQKVKKCRICGGTKFKTYLNLGDQPPSNSFVFKKNKKEKKYSLRLMLCSNCYLSQLDTVVSHKKIFDKYAYLSSTSGALVHHYQKFITNICNNFKLKKHDNIYDIGCNDGIILACYKKNFSNVYGIEPSTTGNIAKKRGFKIIKNFFSYSLAKKIKKTKVAARIITATNVFAHVDNLYDFTKGIEHLIDKKNGIFIIEFPYLFEMLKNLYFDTIYHEHLSYLSVTPLVTLFEKFNLKIFDIQKTNIGASGPGLRVFVSSNISKYRETKNVKYFLNYEKNKISNIVMYKKFATQIKKIKIKINRMINEILKKGHKIGAFGAPAKGNTLLNYLNLKSNKISGIAENNKLKIGKYAPGSKIKIISDEAFLKLDCKYALLLSWNYLNFFRKKSVFYKNGGKFIVPLPKPRII